jgi:hypothetical protein
MIRKFDFLRLRIQWYSKPVALLNVREIDKREFRTSGRKSWRWNKSKLVKTAMREVFQNSQK